MKRKETFFPGEYYHVYSRTILSLPEFKDFKIAQKLANSFLLANSTESTKAFEYLRTYNKATFAKSVEIAWNGDKFVDVVAYAIMPDHYHLLVKERIENGVSNFLQRCNTSISKYISIKKERRGPLFEGPFNAKHIDSNEYLLHLSLYIHLNPLDFLDSKNWRKGNLKNWKSKKSKLLKYPWSSLKSYIFDDYDDWILSGTKIIKDQFKNGKKYSEKDYEKFLKEWSKGSLEKLSDIID